MLGALVAVGGTLVLTSRLRPPSSPPVVFVGLDGADWQLLDEYVSAGDLPTLSRLVGEGRSGVLLTDQPPLSPLVWTTMMTGASPLEHGILDFTRLDPVTGVREPITSHERRLPAVWNMVSARGRTVAVLGLWATWPAEEVRGVVVSDRLFAFQRPEAPPPGVVSPPDREAWAKDALARTEAEVGFAAVHAYLPWLEEAEYARRTWSGAGEADPVYALRRLLVETRVYERLALDALDRDRPDLSIVYLQGTDVVGHVFAPFQPPRLREVSPEDVERYHDVPERYFREIDGFLAEVVRRAEARGAALMIASDHGFRWKEGRPNAVSSVAAATAGQWHREEGMYVVWGPAIASRATRERGRVDQVCATLLALLGLPAAEGAAAPPLAGIPPAAGAAVDYRAGYRPAPEPAPAGAAGEEAIERLRALGYLGASEPRQAPAGALGSTRTASSYNNEGIILRARGQDTLAGAAFDHALAIDPGLSSALWNRSELALADGDPDRADDLLLRGLDGSTESTARLRSRIAAHRAAGGGDRARRLLARAVAARPDDAALRLLRGREALERSDCRAALADFEEAGRMAPAAALAPASAGLARLCLGDEAGARAAFARSLALDPNQPELRARLAGR